MGTPSSQLDRTRFFGRRSLLDRLAELAGTGARLHLAGPSGCGKSRLAREFARHEPGAIYIDLSTAASPADAESVMDASALHEATFVFFEGEPFDLLDRVPESASVCRCDDAFGDTAIEVGPLSHDAALELLEDRVRAGDAEFRIDASNSVAAEELIELSGGWPLVIEQLARRLTLFTPSELLEQCRDGAVPWQGLPGTQAWSTEFDRLGESEWQVFAAALALPGGFDLALMGDIATLAAPRLLDAIETLSAALILRRVDERGASTSRFVVDQSAHAAASTRRSHREAGADRVLQFWTQHAARLWEALARDGGAKLEARFRAEERNAIHSFESVRRRDVEAAAAIGAAVFHCCRTGWSTERQTSWADSLERLLPELEPGETRLALVTALANWKRSSRRFAEAIDLMLPEEGSGRSAVELGLQLELARCLNLLDRFDEARRTFERVRERAPNGYMAFRADAHLGIALHASTNLELDVAREELVHALSISREIDAWRTLERARQAQISVTVTQGDFETAKVHAEAILDELGDDVDPRRVAGAELQLADILVEMNAPGDARASVERAEAILDSYDFARLRGYCHFVRAKVSLLEGDTDLALRHIAEATEMFGEEPSAFLLELIGEVARTVRDPSTVRPDYQDEIAEKAWAYWPPVGATAELLFLACRRLAGMERDEDADRLAHVMQRAEETGMLTRLAAARLLAGHDVEPRGFDGLLIAKLFAPDDARRLVVGPGARWFVVAGGERVDIAGRKALPELLDAIVDAAGEALDPYELAEAGWPDEELHPDTAKNRVYVAVHALRKMGLAEMLRTEGGGYALEHGVVVQREKG